MEGEGWSCPQLSHWRRPATFPPLTPALFALRGEGEAMGVLTFSLVFRDVRAWRS